MGPINSEEATNTLVFLFRRGGQVTVRRAPTRDGALLAKASARAARDNRLTPSSDKSSISQGNSRRLEKARTY